MSNIETKRWVIWPGASAKKMAAAIGAIANRRKSFSENSSAAATHMPTVALREKVSVTATVSAGMTSAAHVRSPRPNSTRAIAIAITSIRSPEYVM